MKWLKQPMIVWYIIAGILLWPAILWWMTNTEHVALFSHIGVVILLFMVGLGLNPVIIKDLWKISLVVWIGQVMFTSVIGIWIALLLWFTTIDSIYISIALAFSSTIIIVKLLSDKGVMDELFGKISIGMLIVQDIIAMLILMILVSLPTTGVVVNWFEFSGILIAKLIIVIAVTYIMMKYVLSKILPYIATSQEFLLVFALGRCLTYAAGLEAMGFSLEIWALLAGVTLASSPYRFEIGSKMKPLRDFFIMIFFVLLWSQLTFGDIANYVWPIIIFSLFVLIGKPFIIMILMGRMWYQKKNSMMVGFTVAQISEFSFVLMSIALSIGHITDINIVSMVTMIWLITIAGSSYYFTYAEEIYRVIRPYLWVFERKFVQTEKEMNSDWPSAYDIVVFGNHRTGKWIVDMLVKTHKNFIIIDCDPHVIKKLTASWLPCKYGDASDTDLLEELNLHKAKMIVSTIHDAETNALILQQTKKFGDHHVTLLSANRIGDAEILYEMGATYVLVPHIVGGHHTAMLIEDYGYDVEKYAQRKIDEYNILGQI
jgi:Kef-type K+ transport system membrane component KefB